jgi:hypothetical protein
VRKGYARVGRISYIPRCAEIRTSDIAQIAAVSGIHRRVGIQSTQRVRVRGKRTCHPAVESKETESRCDRHRLE